MFARILLVLSLLTADISPVLANEPPKVVVTLAPVHALVSGVMQGVGAPILLLKQGEDTHDYALKPSSAKALADADLIIYSGNSVEGYLQKPLDALAREAQLLSLDAGTLQFLMRSNGQIDPHYWLSPANALGIVDAAMQRLKIIDAGNAKTYMANAQRMKNKILQMDTAIKKQLETRPAPGVIPYITYHNAYRYFEEYYGLPQSPYLTADPEKGLKPAEATQMYARIKHKKLNCVFTDAHSATETMKDIAGSKHAKLMKLDPEASTFAFGEDSYFDLMHSIADAVSECFQPESAHNAK